MARPLIFTQIGNSRDSNSFPPQLNFGSCEVACRFRIGAHRHQATFRSSIQSLRVQMSELKGWMPRIWQSKRGAWAKHSLFWFGLANNPQKTAAVYLST